MLKTCLIVGAILGTGLVAVGTGAALGVALGTRALVVSAASVKPVAMLSIAPTGHAGAPAVRVAMRGKAAAAQ